MVVYHYHEYYIYITSNPERSVLYTGVTNNLDNRLIEHWSNHGQLKHLRAGIIVITWYTMKCFLILMMLSPEKSKLKVGKEVLLSKSLLAGCSPACSGAHVWGAWGRKFESCHPDRACWLYFQRAFFIFTDITSEDQMISLNSLFPFS